MSEIKTELVYAIALALVWLAFLGTILVAVGTLPFLASVWSLAVSFLVGRLLGVALRKVK